LFTLTAAILFTAGTVFLMWIGEQITEKGVGNGVSLIIMIGIIARLPASLIQEADLVVTGARNPIVELLYFIVLAAVIAMVVMFTQAVRKIPVQYARRQVGKKQYGGTTQHIPIQLTTANVMPIIFAQAIMFVPTTIVQYMPESSIANFINLHFQYHSAPYAIVLALMIIFFTFFYTAIVFDPRQVAENMRKNGGFVPGVRPGRPTEEYIDAILTRVTVPGSLFLALVAILPTFVGNLGVTGGFAQFYGGTSLLIIVGVTIDTLKQVESYLLMRNYDGFMKSGKLRGRSGMGQGIPVS
jgi:preprotein translocase subunit SecY